MNVLVILKGKPQEEMLNKLITHGLLRVCVYFLK
jgi:hypothetical protein